MRNVSFEIPSQVPDAAVEVIASDVMPAFNAWAQEEQINLVKDVSHFSCQRHENGNDWVFKVHRMDGRCKVFPVVIGAVH